MPLLTNTTTIVNKSNPLVGKTSKYNISKHIIPMHASCNNVLLSNIYHGDYFGIHYGIYNWRGFYTSTNIYVFQADTSNNTLIYNDIDITTGVSTTKQLSIPNSINPVLKFVPIIGTNCCIYENNNNDHIYKLDLENATATDLAYDSRIPMNQYKSLMCDASLNYIYFVTNITSASNPLVTVIRYDISNNIFTDIGTAKYKYTDEDPFLVMDDRYLLVHTTSYKLNDSSHIAIFCYDLTTSNQTSYYPNITKNVRLSDCMVEAGQGNHSNHTGSFSQVFYSAPIFIGRAGNYDFKLSNKDSVFMMGNINEKGAFYLSYLSQFKCNCYDNSTDIFTGDNYMTYNPGYSNIVEYTNSYYQFMLVPQFMSLEDKNKIASMLGPIKFSTSSTSSTPFPNAQLWSPFLLEYELEELS